MTELPHPFLKWAGGKRQHINQLLPLLPQRINTYYEPFLGGGAVFFALAREQRFSQAVLTDTNLELIRTYQAIRGDVEGVIKKLRKHSRAHSESYYYEVRNQNPEDIISIAARMIYLNRTGFNGLYRVNRSGAFNVPFGRYTNPKIVDEENLRECSRALQNVMLFWQDFQAETAVAQPGDAVYFDPPYLPVTKKSFTSYDREPFGVSEHERLAKFFRQLARHGVRVVLTNSATPDTYRLYRGCSIKEIQSRRSINSKGDGRQPISDVIVTRGPYHISASPPR